MNSSGIRVLVADDDPWSQQLISSQLVESGFRVDCAADGWEALILAGRARPDLIVMEVHLPTTDAWTLAEEVRNPRRNGGRSGASVFTWPKTVAARTAPLPFWQPMRRAWYPDPVSSISR